MSGYSVNADQDPMSKRKSRTGCLWRLSIFQKHPKVNISLRAVSLIAMISNMALYCIWVKNG